MKHKKIMSGRGMTLPSPQESDVNAWDSFEEKLALSGPGDSLFHGIEVVQAIQNLANEVSLVADKTTMARVYQNFPGLSSQYSVIGTMRAVAERNGSRVTVDIDSTPIQILPQSSGDLEEQRNDLAKSLNFRLPASVISTGKTALSLVSVTIKFGSFNRTFPVAGFPNTTVTVDFEETPPLHVRVVAIRYSSGGRTFLPSDLDYRLIQSWLRRAYPVADVVWSQTTVDAPRNLNGDGANRVNALLRGIRAMDVSNGMDPRTHYYGLVADGGFFMRGLASGIPSTVASGPTGSSDFGWNHDGSYGDWYTAHELGHTFGRFHAEFCGARGGRAYPFENGQLSNADNEFVGLDVGDQENSLPTQALPGVTWHDVMTYCENQWVSSFTYEGIRDQLMREDQQTSQNAGARGLRPPGEPETKVHAIATVNLTEKTGAFEHVMAHPMAEEAMPTMGAEESSDFTIKILNADGETLEEREAPFFEDACSDHDGDTTGTVDVAFSAPEGAAKLQLEYDGNVIAEYQSAGAPAAAREIRAEAANARGGLTESAERGLTMMKWDGEASDSQTYAIEISKNDGESWETIGVGLKNPNYELDPELVQGAEKVMVRVTATDGFSYERNTETFNVSDL